MDQSSRYVWLDYHRSTMPRSSIYVSINPFSTHPVQGRYEDVVDGGHGEQVRDAKPDRKELIATLSPRKPPAADHPFIPSIAPWLQPRSGTIMTSKCLSLPNKLKPHELPSPLVLAAYYPVQIFSLRVLVVFWDTILQNTLSSIQENNYCSST